MRGLVLTDFGGKRFEANKTFGLGLELGEPTGLTGKYFLSGTNALDFGLGYIYHHYYGRRRSPPLRRLPVASDRPDVRARRSSCRSKQHRT